LWKEHMALSGEDRLVFALKRDKFSSVSLKKGRWCFYALPVLFLYILPNEPMGISGTRAWFSADNSVP